MSLYGIIISFSILVALLLCEKIVKHENKDPGLLWDLSIWVIIFGIAGGRIYHVLDFLPLYLSDPSKIIQVWNGGLGIIGAIFGGAVGAFLYLKIKKEPKTFWFDLGFLILPLSQSVARWGNFVNHENYGLPTDVPWGQYIPTEFRYKGLEDTEKYHPIYLYESVLNFLLFLILAYLYKTNKVKLGTGLMTCIYLTGYFSIRFLIEFFRLNPWKMLGLNVAQMISILVIIPNLSVLIANYRNKKR